MTTKFCYIRDSQNKERVLTLAYEFVEDGVRYAVAVNKPPAKTLSHEIVSTGYGMEQFRPVVTNTGDAFIRKVGRNIASGRLNGGKFAKVSCAKDSVIAAILEDLAKNPKASPANRVASQIFAEYRDLKAT